MVNTSKLEKRKDINPEITLHVGTEKTGTTAIQKMLWSNKDRLLQDGVAYLDCLGPGPNINLTAACLEYNSNSPVLESVGIRNEEQHTEFRKKLKNQIHEELESKKPNSIIISDEHINVHLSKVNELNAIRGYFPGCIVKNVVIYIRRQDYFLESIVSESIKNLSFANSDIKTYRDLLRKFYSNGKFFGYRFQYEKIISNLKKSYPEANLIVRGYSESDTGFNTVEDFCKLFEIEIEFEETGPIDSGRSNKSIPFGAIDALLTIGNYLGKENNSPNMVKWRQAIKVLDAKIENNAPLLEEELREEINGNCSTSNLELVKEYPQLQSVFSTDSSMNRVDNGEPIPNQRVAEMLHDEIDVDFFQLIKSAFSEERKNKVQAVCPICSGGYSLDVRVEKREGPLCCHCLASGRASAIIHTLCSEIYGNNIPLVNQPPKKDVRVVGLSDGPRYSSLLDEKFDYTNTFYHKEPFLDITSPSADEADKYDVLISTEVFEHVIGDVSSAFNGALSVLKPGGLLILTVPFVNNGDHQEHYPGLESYEGREIENNWIVDLKYAGGRVDTDLEPIFHGGPGQTLEVRVFSRDSVLESLRTSGFTDIEVLDDNLPEHGVNWGKASRLITARKMDTAKHNSAETSKRQLETDCS